MLHGPNLPSAGVSYTLHNKEASIRNENMRDNDLVACIEASTKIAKDIHSRLNLYKEQLIDPDSTPELNYICELAEILVQKLESQEGK